MTQRERPMIEELLADSLIRTVMRADHVEPQDLRSLMEGAAARIVARREAGAMWRGVMFRESPFNRPSEATPMDGRMADVALSKPCGAAL